MTVVQLPLLKDESLLPTGKNYISYSELSDWLECSYRHKLRHIQKIKVDEADASIHTIYGTCIHDAIESYLTTKKLPDAKEVTKEFYKNLALNLSFQDFQKVIVKDAKEFADCIPDILVQLPLWIEETFGKDWKLVAAEYKLFEPIANQTNLRFKGFLDAIIKVEKKHTKKTLKLHEKNGTVPPVEYQYVIIDWKTASFGWKAERKRDFKTQLQLILYKHFFCKLMGLDLKDVKCAFVLVKRIVSKTTRKPTDRFEMVPVSVGPVVEERALKLVHSMINQTKKGFSIKNRKYCEPFCQYKGTIHCP